MELSKLPAINAALNATSAVLLITGYIFIQQRSIKSHTMCMVGAFFSSCLFMISYLYYHFHHPSTPFPGQGWSRAVYFPILISHIILAMVNVPLALMTLYQGLRGNFQRHAKLARVSFPIWLYVSVTGVTIYWMLYRITWS